MPLVQAIRLAPLSCPEHVAHLQAYEKVNGLGERLQTPLRALDDKVQSLEKALRGER